MSTGKVLVGVIAGAAVGALLGVLFAPAKGSETRKMISKKGTDTLDELKAKFDEMAASLNDKFSKVKDAAGNTDKADFNGEYLKKEVKSNLS